MRDPEGVFIATALIGLVMAVLFFGQYFKLEGGGRTWVVVVLCSFAVIVMSRDRISEMVLSWKDKSLSVKMDHLQSQVSQIAEAMETLLVAQKINELGPDNTIVLLYEPVPQSVRITCGPLTFFPRPEYGFALEGNKLKIIGGGVLGQINERLPQGGVTVEYLRKVRLDK